MKLISCILFFALPFTSFSQLGISGHQSNLPFVGINYELGKKLRPEIRVGTDVFFESISLEAVLMYDLIDKEDYEFYAGAGGQINGYNGVVFPVGVNMFPFNTKQFGFHIELAPIISIERSIGRDNILRGSWGVRYRFRK